MNPLQIALRQTITTARSFLPTLTGGVGPIAAQQMSGNVAASKTNLTRYISPVQLARVKQDVLSWRSAMQEAENAWYPQRVRMQQLFMDTVLNGHVAACMDKRIRMTLLKPYRYVTTGGAVDQKTTDLLHKKWFREYMRYQLEAKGFGYSLVYMGDIVDDAFPKLSIVRRFNVSPDRLNVTQFVYSISGAPFTEAPFADWHMWCDTPTDVGTSPCGFGYLYKVAFYEIIIRNVVGFNTDATEMYGMPTRIGKTNKSEESAERAIFEQALATLGAAGYLLMDNQGDEVELLESKSMGQGYKIYESLEKRMEAKISKLILGHADAMDSIPGKLGAQDDEDSPVNKAQREIQTTDMNDLMDCTNDQLIPKLRNLGFVIPEGRFEFGNDDELQQQREDEDKANDATAGIFQKIKLAGGDPDWEYFSKRTGIPVTPTPPPAPPVIAGASGDNTVPGKGGKSDAPGTKNGDPKNDPSQKKTAGMSPKTKARMAKIYHRQ